MIIFDRLLPSRFKVLPLFMFLISFWLLIAAPISVSAGSHGHSGHGSDNPILILYDSAGPYDHIGKEHAILLQNLLGHFNLTIKKKPVCEYSTGDIQNHKATFYIGATFDEQSYYDTDSDEWQNYETFLSDCATATAPLVWINYNLITLQSQMDAQAPDAFAEKFGFIPIGVVNNQYNRILYKETQLYKGVVPFANPGADLTGCMEEGDGRYACSTELNALSIVDSDNTTVFAWANSTLSSAEDTPYITQSNNFWFIGDLPFMYLCEEDRYLAFADVLHDVLDVDHDASHRALVRLEDVSTDTDIDALQAATDYLSGADIPFAVATIAQYRDNLIYDQPLALSETGQLLRSLYRNRNASIIAHGYTHQRDCLENPYNGISGDDFEFYRVTLNADNSLDFVSPIGLDTKRGNRRRMQKAKSALQLAGLSPFCWEAPHYLASENAYRGIRELFPIHYGRMVYFNQVGDAPRVIGFSRRFHHPYWGQKPHMLGQFFPYLIHKDAYGYKVIPENICNIEPDPFDGYRPLFPEDLIRHAEKALVVRDGFASFFYHPDYGVDYLKEVVEGIQALGYTFVSADRLFRTR
jgi:uncharacterized protein YdaL